MVEKGVNVKLLGKVTLCGEIECKTGLRVGGAREALEIGGLENIVIRDPVTYYPYIPGSSIKGKMRSLLEKAKSKPITKAGEERIHVCENVEQFKRCEVCRVFGVPAGKGLEGCITLTRLYVRDSTLTEDSVRELEELETEVPYAEVKWENVINRLTSEAMPRQVERVPAGVKFSFEMVYNIFEEEDVDYLRYVFEAMRLVEDDYLGGYGSRGYGRVKFVNISVAFNDVVKVYEEGEENEILRKGKNVDDLLKDQNLIMEIKKKIKRD